MVRAPATATPAATSDAKPAVGFEVDPVRSTTVDYKSPVDKDEDNLVDEQVPADYESPVDENEGHLMEEEVPADYERPGKQSTGTS